MEVKHFDDLVEISMDGREAALLRSMLDEMNETYLEDYDMAVLNELREKL